MPSRRTVFQWLAKHPEFAELYAAAWEAQIDGLLGENVEIADTDPNVERARLRIDVRLVDCKTTPPKISIIAASVVRHDLIGGTGIILQIGIALPLIVRSLP